VNLLAAGNKRKCERPGESAPLVERAFWGTTISPVASSLDIFPGLAGWLKACDVTARAGASIASGGPGNAR
jgi:hypothetical protein